MQNLLEYIKKSKPSKYYTGLTVNMNTFNDVLKIVKQFNYQYFDKSYADAADMSNKTGNIIIRELIRDIKIVSIPIKPIIKIHFYLVRNKIIERCVIRQFGGLRLLDGDIIYDGPFNSKFVDLFNTALENFIEE